MAQPVLYRAHPTERLLDGSWLCQWMYSSINASTSPRVCSSRRSEWTDSTFVPPRKPSAAASSSERPFAPVDPVGPNRSWVPAIPAAYGDGRGRNAPEDARPRATWRSITGEGCALPSAVLVSVMSVSRFSLGRSAVKFRSDQVPTRAGVVSPSWEPYLRRPEHAPRARPRP